MHIKFTANDVSRDEANGGEIVQVSFQEDADDDDPFNPTKYYLNISINYEFPPIVPTIGWFDGKDGDGGANALKYTLSRTSFQLWLDNGYSFDIDFEIDDVLYIRVKKSIEKLLEECEIA